jgi:hypothetical protein
MKRPVRTDGPQSGAPFSGILSLTAFQRRFVQKTSIYYALHRKQCKDYTAFERLH